METFAGTVIRIIETIVFNIIGTAISVFKDLLLLFGIIFTNLGNLGVLGILFALGILAIIVYGVYKIFKGEFKVLIIGVGLLILFFLLALFA